MRVPTRKKVISDKGHSSDITLSLIFAALSVLIRLLNFSQHSLWLDEVSYLGYRFIDILNPVSVIEAAHGVSHPPLYLWVFASWMRLFGVSEIFTMLLSMLCSGVFFFFFYRFLRSTHLSQNTSIAITVFALFIPLIHHYALDVTEYMFFPMLIMIGIYYVSRYYETLKLQHLILSLIFFLLALYTHYYAIVVILVVLPILVIQNILHKKFSTTFPYLISFFLLAISSFVWSFTDVKTYGGNVTHFFTLHDFLRNITTVSRDMFSLVYPNLSQGHLHVSFYPIFNYLFLALLFISILFVFFRLVILATLKISIRAFLFLRFFPFKAIFPFLRYNKKTMKLSKNDLKDIDIVFWRELTLFFIVAGFFALMSFQISTFRIKGTLFLLISFLYMFAVVLERIKYRTIVWILVLILLVPNVLLLNYSQSLEEDWESLGPKIKSYDLPIIIPVQYTYPPFLYYYNQSAFKKFTRTSYEWHDKIYIFEQYPNASLNMEQIQRGLDSVNKFLYIYTDHVEWIDPSKDVQKMIDNDFVIMNHTFYGRIDVRVYERK